ncbi:MAG: hypothetical protein KBH75_05835 [Saprospiraceae bacterium]|nr:hypothetical protein [Saprospiraceae bacterium]
MVQKKRKAVSIPGMLLALMLLVASQADPIMRSWWKSCVVEVLTNRESVKNLHYFCLEDLLPEDIIWLDGREFVYRGEWFDVVSLWESRDGSVELLALRDRAEERAAGIVLAELLPGKEFPQLNEPSPWGEKLLYPPVCLRITDASFHPVSPIGFVAGEHYEVPKAPEAPPPDYL